MTERTLAAKAETNSDANANDNTHVSGNSHSNIVLSVKDLSWQLNGTAILSAIEFSLTEGKMLGIIGPNGAGKSSLLRCLYRFIQPTTGCIHLFGDEINTLSAKAFARQIAVVLQDTPHHFEMTTAQLIALGLTPHKGAFDFSSRGDREVIAQALAKVGLQDKANQAYESLSGGEKQRALIARAIVQRPKLLILDEPTNHLDIRYQIQTLELLRSLKITVITSIHDLNLASALCDELLLLNNGRSVAKGSPKAVLTEKRIAEVFDVCCEIKPHPQHGNPLISYFYGYDASLADSTQHSIENPIAGGLDE
ncbi:ABC transporter ATP-binding protein [Shewanella pealeana]|uniref:ABC transporter related n=1 Tax=Shewanella pealeana (strain ATCC 700345 / ANG-SQ1) TaxID=398579 RepID=A8H809_SHEPA|nr:ABC transporter ATP-binding protein [Shewanella pealeana]ABV88696.1 ABC transporter related [Shewanella pealeana ATCC 700345]